MSESPSTPDPAEGREGEPRFSFTDKRKVNPEDGSVRPTEEPVDPIDAEAAELFEKAAAEGEQPSAEAERVRELEAQVAELTETLKRDQAEYVNSRRRIEASAQAGQQAAIASVLTSLIGVLDDIDLGRQHGDIVEGTPFHAISQKLETALGSHGLERFGAVGEEFDPTLHEALMHEDSEDVEVNTITLVMQPGYRMHDRVLRPARVGTRGPQ
ncbi:nucleotide exchange factor GrpE [Brachybacterium hainanense]|uniref:Protein GrpE n=1 Tax=Brachybacterium hainanense TaxID=1541174 RepID=A0ABV6RE56_9MICO